MTLRLRVLGPMRAWHDEEPIALGPPCQRTVLGLLVLAGGQPVTQSALVDAIWGAAPPATAVNVIQTHVKRLRRLLEPARASHSRSEVLPYVGGGYRLEVIWTCWPAGISCNAARTTGTACTTCSGRTRKIWPCATGTRRCRAASTSSICTRRRPRSTCCTPPNAPGGRACRRWRGRGPPLPDAAAAARQAAWAMPAAVPADRRACGRGARQQQPR